MTTFFEIAVYMIYRVKRSPEVMVCIELAR